MIESDGGISYNQYCDPTRNLTNWPAIFGAAAYDTPNQSTKPRKTSCVYHKL